MRRGRRWSCRSSPRSLRVRAGRRCGTGLHRRGGLADRGDDVLVARAAAVVALERVADLAVGRLGVPGEEVGRDHDHARRAEAALEAVLLPERLLQRMEAVAGGEALDRRDAAAVRLDREHRAALHGVAVDVDGAGAALARVAADVGAGELEVLPNELDEEASGLDVRLPSLTVDRERNMLGHQWSLLPLFGRWVAPGLRMRRGRCRRAVVKSSNAGTDASAVQAHVWFRRAGPTSMRRDPPCLVPMGLALAPTIAPTLSFTP